MNPFLLCLIGIPTKTPPTMQYELKHWEELLARHRDEPLFSIQGQLDEENERIRLAFLAMSCSDLPIGTIERQISIHLKAIGLMGEKLVKIEDAEKRVLFKGALIDLVDALEASLTTVWPRDAIIPQPKLEQLRNAIHVQAHLILQMLEDKRVATEFIDLLRKLFIEFTEDEGDVVYGAWYKIRDLAEGLADGFIRKISQGKFAPSSFQADATDKAINIVLQLDINSHAILRFLQDRATKRLLSHPDVPGQVMVLKGLLHYFGERKDRGTPRSMFCEWLEGLLQEKQQAMPETPEESDRLAELMKGKIILTSLTSSELGCMLRLFIDTGVFSNDNIKDVAFFMAQFMGTKKKGVKTTRSVNNLYANIYTIPETTSLEVDRILQAMIARNAQLRQEALGKKRKPKVARLKV